MQPTNSIEKATCDIMKLILPKNPEYHLDLGSGISNGFRYRNIIKPKNILYNEIDINYLTGWIFPCLFMNIVDVHKYIKPKFFDLITCFDVIEHLHKNEGEQLIYNLEKLCNGRLVFQTPIGEMWINEDSRKYVASEEEKHLYEKPASFHTHLCGWLPEEFTERGYSCWIFPNVYKKWDKGLFIAIKDFKNKIKQHSYNSEIEDYTNNYWIDKKDNEKETKLTDKDYRNRIDDLHKNLINKKESIIEDGYDETDFTEEYWTKAIHTARFERNPNNIIKYFKDLFTITQHPGSIIDISAGAGNGVNGFRLAGFDAYGCEFSSSGRKVAKEKFEIVLDPCDLRTKLPYETDQFDWGCCYASLSMIPRNFMYNAISEILRIVKYGVMINVCTEIAKTSASDMYYPNPHHLTDMSTIDYWKIFYECGAIEWTSILSPSNKNYGIGVTNVEFCGLFSKIPCPFIPNIPN